MKNCSLICFISLVLISGAFAQQNNDNQSAAVVETLNKYAAAILMKTAGGWKIQHMHTSRIPPKKPDEKK